MRVRGNIFQGMFKEESTNGSAVTFSANKKSFLGQTGSPINKLWSFYYKKNSQFKRRKLPLSINLVNKLSKYQQGLVQSFLVQLEIR